MYENELQKRAQELEKLVSVIGKELPKLPEGKLRIVKKNNTLQYFHIQDAKDTCGKYLKVEERKFADALARKSYLEKLLAETQRELRAIEKYLKGVKGTRPEDVFEEMTEYRKQMVKPLILSDKAYAAEWEKESYRKNPYKPEECVHDTKKGEKVRSKTEARIADMYYDMGISYRYEAELKLKNGKVKYPDFSLLKRSSRELIYHEHLGIIEDEQYRRSNIIKLAEYQESGIVTGKNLLLTFETDYQPLSLKDLKKAVQKIMLE